jgi:hypothetical protein
MNTQRNNGGCILWTIIFAVIFAVAVIAICANSETSPATKAPSTAAQQPPVTTPAPSPLPAPKPVVQSVNVLSNPGFELSSADRPLGWTTAGWKPGKFVWDNTVAHSGRYSVKIESPQANDLRWVQKVNVRPASRYKFTAWVRTLDVGHSREANDVGANLSVDGVYLWSEDLKGTSDWTLLSSDIATGPKDSTITVALRLGFNSGTNTGTVWFDDASLALIEGGDMAVFEGKQVILELFGSDASAIRDVPGWLRKLDTAYGLYEELVGSSPYDGEKIVIQEVPPMKYGGLAGNPILINQQILNIDQMNDLNDLNFGVMHELAHDFDIPPYSGLYIGDGAINAEGWANLKLVYAADQMSPLYPEATFWGDGVALPLGERGAEFERKYAVPYLQVGRRDGLQMNNDVLTGLLYSLKRQIGWGPFKATFRDYRTYNAGRSTISSSDDKMRLFVKLLSKNSGVDLAPAFRSWGFDIQ